MSEHFTRNTESLRCWCYTCNDMTEHTVSDGRIGRCQNDHTKKRDPRRAQVPQLALDRADEIEIRPGALKDGKHVISIEDRRSITALDGAGNRGEK
jgi:hypothetical protein